MTDPLRVPVLLETLANGKWCATAITVSMKAVAATRQDALDGVAEAIRRKMKRLLLAPDEERYAPGTLYVNDKPRFFHNWVAAMVQQSLGKTMPPFEASGVNVPMPEPQPTEKP